MRPRDYELFVILSGKTNPAPLQSLLSIIEDADFYHRQILRFAIWDFNFMRNLVADGADVNGIVLAAYKLDAGNFYLWRVGQKHTNGIPTERIPNAWVLLGLLNAASNEKNRD